MNIRPSRSGNGAHSSTRERRQFPEETGEPLEKSPLNPKEKLAVLKDVGVAKYCGENEGVGESPDKERGMVEAIGVENDCRLFVSVAEKHFGGGEDRRGVSSGRLGGIELCFAHLKKRLRFLSGCWLQGGKKEPKNACVKDPVHRERRVREEDVTS